MRKFVNFIVLVVLFSSCEKKESPSYQIEANAKILLDVAYGAHDQQKMDVYLPVNRSSNTGIIIFVHGGSFIGGDKADLTAIAKPLATTGYAVLNVNYRLVDGTELLTKVKPARIESDVKVQDQITDISSIVDYAIAHAKEWVVNANRIVIIGHSAGGSLALLYSYDQRNTNKVKAVANLAGPLDLVFSNVPNWEKLSPALFEAGYRLTGFEFDVENEQYYKNISALSMANATQKVPTLNIFPQNNTIQGLPKQDRAVYDLFTKRLNELKVPNEFFYVAGANHNFTQKGKWQLVLEKSMNYFNTVIK